jgi:hypothetical protein
MSPNVSARIATLSRLQNQANDANVTPHHEPSSSARRGSVTGRACRTRRIMFGEHRPPNQERRPSARRGVQNQPRAVRIERCSATSETTTKTGAVSPPWFGNRAGSTERFLPNEDARMPRGAYAPRSWWSCGADICRRNCDLCDTRTLVYRSADRQPAVARETHLSVRFRKVAGVF